MKSFVFFARTGCFLPLLIIFNLFFGWIFLNWLIWLRIEAILVLVFVVNYFLLAKKIAAFSSKKNSNVIDIEGEVVKENTKSAKITQKNID